MAFLLLWSKIMGHSLQLTFSKRFLETFGTSYKTCGPFHPASSGQVERYVEINKMTSESTRLNSLGRNVRTLYAA